MSKKTKIKTVIRKIVREEVAMAIQEVITELKNPLTNVEVPVIQKNVKKAVEKKQYSKNSVLNEVMNETANDDEWKNMGEGTYTTDSRSEVLKQSYGDMMNKNDDNTNGSLAVEMGVNPDTPGMDFLKKDYREVMKAVDEKTKQKRGM